MASSPITSWQIDGGKVETVTDFLFLGSKITADVDCSHEMKRHLLLGRNALTSLHSILKKLRHYSTDKDQFSQSYDFSSSHVWMWELDYKEVWVLNNWCCQTVVLEETLESLLDHKAMKPINPKGIFTGRTDADIRSNTLATWCKETILWKRPWCWERLKAGEEGNIGWSGWMTAPTQWTWVWANSGR